MSFGYFLMVIKVWIYTTLKRINKFRGQPQYLLIASNLHISPSVADSLYMYLIVSGFSCVFWKRLNMQKTESPCASFPFYIYHVRVKNYRGIIEDYLEQQLRPYLIVAIQCQSSYEENHQHNIWKQGCEVYHLQHNLLSEYSWGDSTQLDEQMWLDHCMATLLCF